MKVKELFELINNSEETLYCLDDFEDLIGDKCEKVASNLDIDQHGWHSCATDVYKCEDGYVGIYAGFQLFSEQMDWSDARPDTCVSEYEAVQKVTYRPKKCQSL